jgi:hypothetical protein
MAKAELIKARELIANGWIQGALVDKRSGNLCYCLDGAVGAAYIDSEYFSYDTIRATPGALADLQYLTQFTLPLIQNWGILVELSPEDVKKYGSELEVNYSFNDNSNTSQADVLAVLDTAIEKYPDETGV